MDQEDEDPTEQPQVFDLLVCTAKKSVVARSPAHLLADLDDRLSEIREATRKLKDRSSV